MEHRTKDEHRECNHERLCAGRAFSVVDGPVCVGFRIVDPGYVSLAPIDVDHRHDPALRAGQDRSHWQDSYSLAQG